MTQTSGSGTTGESRAEGPPTGVVPPRIGDSCPYPKNLLPLDPEALRAEAVRILNNASTVADFSEAERVLMGALTIDPSDVTGRTRYLLALACFHQQRWVDA